MKDDRLAAFEQLYGSLKTLQHREVIFGSKDKLRHLEAIYPLVSGMGKLPYSCRSIIHPSQTCGQYFIQKLAGSAVKGLQLCFLTLLVPSLVSMLRKLKSESR